MRKYKTYKDSGVEWIGEIPEHWNLKPLKHIVECNRESLPENTPKNQLINYIEIGDVSADHGITGFEKYEFEKAPSRARRIVKEGDVLISTVRTYLKAIASIERQFDNYVVSTGFAVLTPKKVDSTYLTNIVLSNGFIGEIISLSKGVSYPSITSSDLLQIKVPFPSSLEQEDIGAYLDQKTAEIETLIAKKEQLIKLLEEERTAMINQAVTKGLDPNVPMKDSGIDWLGKVPEHWEVKSIKHVAILKSGETITSEKIKSVERYPVYGGNGLRGYFSNYTNEGDFILIGRQGALCGNIKYVSGKFWASEHAVVCYLNPGYNWIWFGKLLETMNLIQYNQSAAQPGLAVGLIKNLKIPTPPFGEQTRIIEFIDNYEKIKNSLIKKYFHEIDLLKEYKTALISEVVTGKIDVREEVLN